MHMYMTTYRSTYVHECFTEYITTLTSPARADRADKMLPTANHQ